jgi:hypothetical protein
MFKKPFDLIPPPSHHKKKRLESLQLIMRTGMQNSCIIK